MAVAMMGGLDISKARAQDPNAGAPAAAAKELDPKELLKIDQEATKKFLAEFQDQLKRGTEEAVAAEKERAKTEAATRPGLNPYDAFITGVFHKITHDAKFGGTVGVMGALGLGMCILGWIRLSRNRASWRATLAKLQNERNLLREANPGNALPVAGEAEVAAVRALEAVDAAEVDLLLSLRDLHRSDTADFETVMANLELVPEVRARLRQMLLPADAPLTMTLLAGPPKGITNVGSALAKGSKKAAESYDTALNEAVVPLAAQLALLPQADWALVKRVFSNYPDAMYERFERVMTRPGDMSTPDKIAAVRSLPHEIRAILGTDLAYVLGDRLVKVKEVEEIHNEAKLTDAYRNAANDAAKAQVLADAVSAANADLPAKRLEKTQQLRDSFLKAHQEATKKLLDAVAALSPAEREVFARNLVTGEGSRVTPELRVALLLAFRIHPGTFADLPAAAAPAPVLGTARPAPAAPPAVESMPLLMAFRIYVKAMEGLRGPVDTFARVVSRTPGAFPGIRNLPVLPPIDPNLTVEEALSATRAMTVLPAALTGFNVGVSEVLAFFDRIQDLEDNARYQLGYMPRPGTAAMNNWVKRRWQLTKRIFRSHWFTAPALMFLFTAGPATVMQLADNAQQVVDDGKVSEDLKIAIITASKMANFIPHYTEGAGSLFQWAWETNNITKDLGISPVRGPVMPGVPSADSVQSKQLAWECIKEMLDEDFAAKRVWGDDFADRYYSKYVDKALMQDPGMAANPALRATVRQSLIDAMKTYLPHLQGRGFAIPPGFVPGNGLLPGFTRPATGAPIDPNAKGPTPGVTAPKGNPVPKGTDPKVVPPPKGAEVPKGPPPGLTDPFTTAPPPASGPIGPPAPMPGAPGTGNPGLPPPRPVPGDPKKEEPKKVVPVPGAPAPGAPKPKVDEFGDPIKPKTP